MSPAPEPIFTRRVTLEVLTADHAESLWSPLQAPELYQWISSSAPLDVSSLRARWQSLGRVAGGTSLGWAARRTADGAWLGKLDAMIDDAGVATNVGYLFFPPFWGKGYATEAVSGLAEWLLAQGIAPLVATVTVGNDASCRVLEKAHFRRTGRLLDNDVIRGVRCDDWRYERAGSTGRTPTA